MATPGVVPQGRRIEIDLLRSAAILGMVIYHAAFDVWMLTGSLERAGETGWWLLARGTATLFLLLAGCSAALSLRGLTMRERWTKAVRRWWRIAAAAVLVSGATYAAEPSTYVRFGILHLIAVSSLVLPLTHSLREGSAIVGVLCIALGREMAHLQASHPFLLPLGITYPGFATVDFFPLFPWVGVVLIGQAIGQLCYTRLALPGIAGHPRLLRALAAPGRYSLAIYLLHQPILLAILHAVR